MNNEELAERAIIDPVLLDDEGAVQLVNEDDLRVAGV